MLPALACLALLAADLPADAPADDRAAYRAAADAAGRDPDAHVRLALWCEAREMAAERLGHLAQALLADPENATARGLMGQVRNRDGRWVRAADRADDPRLAEDLAEYNRRRAKLGLEPNAEDHWRLALWCEERGLEPEKRAHLAAVVQLDPGRDAAWKRLGCKKVGGRWMTEEQVAAETAEREAQREANRDWKARLASIRRGLAAERTREEAEAALAEVADPRAVAAIWAVFAAGRAPDHDRAVQLLGQVDARAASRALAFLAVFSPSDRARQAAGEALRHRDSREFADFLIGLMGDELRYEVRRVGGPGSPGVLFVEGRQFNVQRLYSPPPMPNLPLYAGEAVAFDADGLPVVSRFLGIDARESTMFEQLDRVTLAEARQGRVNNSEAAAVMAEFARDADERVAQAVRRRGVDRNAFWLAPEAWEAGASVIVGREVVTRRSAERHLSVPVGRMAVEHAKAAHSAQAQLEADVAAIDARNAAVKRGNARVASLLREVAGVDLGEDRERWRAWYVDQLGYSYRSPTPTPRPTIVNQVPLAYRPADVPVTPYETNVRVEQQVGQATTRVLSSVSTFSSSCFGAGTPVHTRDGLKPIEEVRVGDLVLSQDTVGGSLSYQPVLDVLHNQPTTPLRVTLGGEEVVATPIHRFWVGGRGWVMARELKPGDPVRTLGGLRSVDSVEPGEVQPVFNLEVASARNFFVGRSGALVHDHTLPDFRATPFDRPADLVAAGE